MVLVAINARNASRRERRERRGSLRRRFCLDAEAQIHAGLITPIVVHELSRSGFLMETSESLHIGERLQICLPGRGSVPARVVWSCGRHLGCEFQRPLSNGAISAALLRSRPAVSSESLPPSIHLGQDATAEQTAVKLDARLPSQFRLVLASSVLLWAVVAALIIYAT